MATKKAAPAKPAKSTALIPWNEKFAKYAKEGKEQIKNIGTGGVSVKFGRNTITVGGVTVPGGKMEAVIIGSCALNAWYEADFDPNDAQPPDCYAFSVIADDPDMAPHESAANKQSDNCADCEKNQFGTAKTGRGKACSNNIRLGLITGKDASDANGASSAELAVAKVSPTNLKNYAGYIKSLDDEHGRPIWSVVTEISSHDDPKTQIRLEFRLVDLIEDEALLATLEKRFLGIQGKLQTPYGPPIDRPKPAARKSVNQKFAGKAGRR
jgi:hypothetical protein